jgi:hypothetical protein
MRVRIGILAQGDDSTPSRRVRLATEQMWRSPHRSS